MQAKNIVIPSEFFAFTLTLCVFFHLLQKTYKYGCDLVSAAQRTRKSCQLDQESSSSLLTELNSVWEQLSLGIEERKARLDQATQFHGLVDEVCVCNMQLYVLACAACMPKEYVHVAVYVACKHISSP